MMAASCGSRVASIACRTGPTVCDSQTRERHSASVCLPKVVLKKTVPYRWIGVPGFDAGWRTKFDVRWNVKKIVAEAGGAEEPPGENNRRDKPLYARSDYWLQVGILVFALGFIDAGFSGDWSRIGVLTKEAEEDLKMAAIGVVPLAGTLVWSISKRRSTESK